jgi:hypothetical protein
MQLDSNRMAVPYASRKTNSGNYAVLFSRKVQKKANNRTSVSLEGSDFSA